MYNENNVFHKILEGKLGANKVYEDEYALAFYDINPSAKVHVLVISKGAYVNYHDFLNRAAANEVAGFFKAINETVKVLELSEDGFRIVSNIGTNGGQEVPHFHVHILGGEKLGHVLV